MIQSDFLLLLQKSARMAHDFAQEYVLDELPGKFAYDVQLNASHDDPALKQFDIYPEDKDKRCICISEEEVVELLCRKGKVPVWIDINVNRIQGGKTVFHLLCAGRYSDNEQEYYYQAGGTGPFGIKSPVLPVDYEKGRKFRLGGNFVQEDQPED